MTRLIKHYFEKKFTVWQLFDLVLFWSLLVFMWFLFSGNTGNSDYDNYTGFYRYYDQHTLDALWYPGLEKGFSILMKASNFFKLSYTQFLGAYSFIGLSLIANSMLKYSNFRFLPLFFYFSYQFFLDIVQIRNFMLLAIFIFSLRYLTDWYSTDKKKSLIKYIVLILIGTQMHITGVFFLLPIFTKRISKQKLVVSISTITMLCIMFKPFIMPTFNRILNGSKYDLYLKDQTSFFGSSLMIVYVLIGLIIIKYLYDRIKENENKAKTVLDFAEVTMKLNILMILTIFFFSIRPDFIRIVRNVQVINYIMLAQCLKPRLISLKAKNLLSSTAFILFFLGSTFMFLWFSNIDGVLQPVLTNNIYFNN